MRHFFAQAAHRSTVALLRGVGHWPASLLALVPLSTTYVGQSASLLLNDLSQSYVFWCLYWSLTGGKFKFLWGTKRFHNLRNPSPEKSPSLLHEGQLNSSGGILRTGNSNLTGSVLCFSLWCIVRCHCDQPLPFFWLVLGTYCDGRQAGIRPSCLHFHMYRRLCSVRFTSIHAILDLPSSIVFDAAQSKIEARFSGVLADPCSQPLAD